MTKLRPEQLSRALADSLPAVILISGDEPLLTQEAADSVRREAQTQGFSERELYHADASFDWGQIANAGNSLSLFADKKIIELRLPSGKPGDKGARALIDATAQPANDNLLLIICGKLEKTALNSKWYKAVEAAGIHVAVWPVEPTQLPRWIGTRLKQAGLRADNSAIDLLASRIEGNLLAAAQEIEKLKLLSSDGNVSTELMASVVADSARYDIFGLTDKALAGDARGAIKSLHGLKSEGTDAMAILWALTREIRQLLQAATAMAQSKSTDAAMKQAGIWPKRQALARAALQRLKPAHLQQLLRQAGGIDRAIKGMRNAEAWDDLLDLVLNLAGVVSLTPANVRLGLKL